MSAPISFLKTEKGRVEKEERTTGAAVAAPDTTLGELEKWINLTVEEKRAVQYSPGRLKMAITPHFAG